MSQLLKLREQKHLTQEELAEKAGVSVRTIQRIEAGTVPKGHTLKTLAETLEVSKEDLLDVETEELNNNLLWLKLINLSSLVFMWIPLGNILAPLIISAIKKEKNVMVKQLVSLQIMWTILALVAFLLSPFLQRWFDITKQLVLGVLIVSILINVFFILRNAIEIDKRQKLYIKLNFSII